MDPFAFGAAALGLFAGIAHSLIGERAIFRPLQREEQAGVLRGRSTRAVVRAVWHIPSFVWIVLALAVLLHGDGPASGAVATIAAIVFAGSGIGNIAALRRPHFGGITLLLAAASALAAAVR
jgi:hypothetical protein